MTLMSVCFEGDPPKMPTNYIWARSEVNVLWAFDKKKECSVGLGFGLFLGSGRHFEKSSAGGPWYNGQLQWAFVE